MELYLRKEGKEIPVKEIKTLDKETEVLFFFINCVLRDSDIEKTEEVLSNKIGRKVVILDSKFEKDIKGI